MAKATSTPAKKEQKLISTSTLKSIDAHKNASDHLLKAAKYHLEAIEHHKAGSHEQASHSGVLAHGHTSLAKDTMKENAKRQVMDKK
jgi:hypothetical protein